MISIRRRLLTWLVTGSILLWLSVGAAVYITVRTSLENTFDAELQAIASEVRYLFPESGGLVQPKPSPYWLDFFQPASGLYFEVWDEYLLFSDRSPSLGEQGLPQPPAFQEEPTVWNLTLGSGEKVRGLALQVDLVLPMDRGIGAPEQVLNMVVARNRDGLDRSLALLLGVTALAGILIVPIGILLGHVAVKRGLAPLAAFSDRVDSFGIDTLHERFQTHDIPAELRPVAERLNGLLDRLEAGLERERRLNADLAHELRTPIAELKTMSEVALAWPDKIDGTNYRDILDAVDQMQSIIDGMLLLARCETGAERPVTTDVRVSDLMDTCWEPYAEAARGKKLNLQRDLSPDLRWETNPDLFQVIVTNLLSNAVEYSPEGGDVLIRCSGEGDRFTLSVTNSAEHLETDELPHLFERFWRRDTARTGSGHAGLGLALAQSAANVLGLNLAADLEKSAGTVVFSLTSEPC